MSNPSDDEEDFLSADEDGFGEEETTKKTDDKDVELDEEELTVSEPASGSSATVDDDEEALAERIRERNLRIARKFSAEIAKSVKASAPIPVKGATPSDLKINDLDQDSNCKSSLPPAPPPTPALSSSFNSSIEIPSGPSSTPTSTSQYSWRVPNQPSTVRPQQADAKPNEPKSDQTRMALDRLSESLSQSDKNLFEKVAADLKKVSIRPKTETSEGGEGVATSSGVSIPLISDLGSTLGGWSWNSATKLLTSASQVTSHVGTVIDSVSQHLQQPSSSQQTQPDLAAGEEKPGACESGSCSNDSQPRTSELNTNDGLVDFTLNTMESLGKKAFGVMTERSESGILQIKGIGRPWEHLMNNVNKQTSSDQDHDSDELESKALPAPTTDIRRRKKAV